MVGKTVELCKFMAGADCISSTRNIISENECVCYGISIYNVETLGKDSEMDK